MHAHMHTHMQDSDKKDQQDSGIERYFHNPGANGDSCLCRQFRGYEVEVLPKTIPVREVTLHTCIITMMHDTAHQHIQGRSLELTHQAYLGADQ